MSSQSGISVSPQLAKEFPSFVEGDEIAVILAIDHAKEHVDLQHRVRGTVSDVQKQLGQGKEPKYIILRLPEQSSQFAFVQFMPDLAPLSAKMKYASSHATIHRQLGGSSIFTTNIFWTELDEVSTKGLDAHNAHEQAPAPLTEEEQSLATAVELEQTQGTGGKSVANQATLAVNANISEDSTAALQSLQNNRALLFTVSSDSRETIELAAQCSAEDLAQQAASADGPRYVVVRLNSINVFAFVCPRSSSIKQRMLFASTRIAFLDLLKSHYQVETTIETFEPEEDLKLEQLKKSVSTEDETEKIAVQKPRFQRPRPPKRK